MGLTNLIPGFTWIKAAVFGLAALALFSAGSYAGYRWEVSVVDSIKLADAQKEVSDLKVASALTVDTDKIGIRIGGDFAAGLDHTVFVTQTILKEVPRYVTPAIDARYPLPWGLVRVHDAAIARIAPSALPLPAGQSDDAPAPAHASDLAANDAANFGACYANADQLKAVEAWVSQVAETWNARAGK